MGVRLGRMEGFSNSEVCDMMVMEEWTSGNELWNCRIDKVKYTEMIWTYPEIG